MGALIGGWASGCTTGLISNSPISYGRLRRHAHERLDSLATHPPQHIADDELAFSTTSASLGTTIETLAKIEGRRRTIEDSFETAKNELGLDHNETRSWHGCPRHVSLVMLVFATKAAVRVHANAATPPKIIRRKMHQIPR